MHVRVLKALEMAHKDHLNINVPRCYALISADDQQWKSGLLSRFPQSPPHEPCKALISERIQPFPREVRERLIERFCHENSRASALESLGNEDCIIRPYLGRRTVERHASRASSRPRHFFSLRNLPLHMDQLEDIGADVTGYAYLMGQATALLHWEAHIDGNDCEFVLAPPRLGEQALLDVDLLDQHTMWLLDFDLCRSMAADEEGVAQAVEAFFGNDPYFPKPGRNEEGDEVAWRSFASAYLKQSQVYMGESKLPECFIKGVSERAACDKAKKEAATLRNETPDTEQ